MNYLERKKNMINKELVLTNRIAKLEGRTSKDNNRIVQKLKRKLRNLNK